MQLRRWVLVLPGALLLISLACGLPFLGDEAESVPDAVQTAEAAARGAGAAAQTAAAQAGDVVGTVAAVATTQGSSAMATVVAVATPHVAYLKEKLESIEPDAEGNYRVALSENDVNTLLRIRQLLSGDLIGAAIQSQEVTFSDGRITLSGRILEPLPGQLRVTMRPAVGDGRLQLDIEEASVAGQEAPQRVLDAAESGVSGALDEVLANLPASVTLQEIIVADGELIIVGRKAAGG